MATNTCARFRTPVAMGLLAFLLVAAGSAQWSDPDRSEPAGTRYRTFPSQTAGGEVSYLLYLPPGYEEAGQRRFPVIYWLHGLNGTQRTGQFFVSLLDAAIRAGQAPPAIVVLVNGLRDSMYCDTRDGRPVETVVVRELIPHVDAAYRTIAQRRARAIEGYSMGGFGAAHLGFKYPDLFGAISVMAGALHTEESLPTRRKEIFEKIFGGDAAYLRANTAQTLAERNAAQLRGRTAVRIGVGDQDQLLDWNRSLHERLGRLGVENEFFTAEGVGHQGARFYQVLGDRQWAFYRRAFGKPVP